MHLGCVQNVLFTNDEWTSNRCRRPLSTSTSVNVMPLSFPVFFESEFLPLTLFFLWCLFRFSFKIVINLFCGRHFWCLCFVTEQKVTRQLMKKGRGRLTHPGQNPPRQVPSQRHVSEGFEFDERLHIWICLDLVLKGQYNVLKSIEWRV